MSHHRFSVAPMLEWTDEHYRFMARLLSRRTLLFTEMVPLGAIVKGDKERFLRRGAEDAPVVLQIGGSEAEWMAEASREAKRHGFSEININCGCPSPKVRKGSFGACLMREADLVARMILEAGRGSDLPCTVKHRIGLDRIEEYSFVRDFVGEVAHKSGNKIYYVHARNAWLDGLSPKENREIPPLRHDVVHRLKEDFPDLLIVLNGGVASHEEAASHLQKVDGVMVGRKAYRDPLFLRDADRIHFGDATPSAGDEELVLALRDYCREAIARDEGTGVRHVYRHALNLFQGRPGSKAWRRTLGDHELLDRNDPDIVLRAFELLWKPSRSRDSAVVDDRDGGSNLGESSPPDPRKDV